MPRIAIVTESSACLPADVVERYGIFVVPLGLLFGGQLFRDGELPGSEFYARLRVPSQRATTAAPAPGEFLQAFRQARSAGARAVLCLTLSSHYSGAHSAAVNAAHLAPEEISDLEVRVIDTGGIAMAHGFAVLDAAKAAAAGATLDQAASAAERAAGSATLVGVLDTTRYLARSGRVPWILHFMTSLLGIKPIIAQSGGKVRAVGRVRTMARGIDRMVDYVLAKTTPGTPIRIAIMHADAADRARELASHVTEKLAPAELQITEFTSVMAVHTGPGFLGLAWAPAAPAAFTETAAAPKPSLLERDVATLERALGPLPAPLANPPFIVLSGLPGSGKSHLAREIARRYPVALVESDAFRKALVKRPSYSQSESARLFAASHTLIENLLRRGIPVLFDATNLREVHRKPLYAIAEAAGAHLLLVQVSAPAEVVRRRMEGRTVGENPSDRSDATLDVYEMMIRDAEPIERPHLVIDSAADDLDRVVSRILRELESIRA